ncbi:MAG: Crp/Fnr family transcriptional regulator [Sphingobacteriaceae bacterium]
MRKLTIKHDAWKRFKQFWAKYYELDSDDIEWTIQYVEILEFARYTTLCRETQMQRNLYFVCDGLLARAVIDPEMNRRVIYQIAGENQALFTGYHRYSKTRPPGDIIALKKTFVIKIPYQVINRFVPQYLALSKLIMVLGERNKKDHIRLSDVKTHRNAAARFCSFYHTMPDYRAMLTIHQQADLLKISPTSVKNFQKILLMERNPKK